MYSNIECFLFGTLVVAMVYFIMKYDNKRDEEELLKVIEHLRNENYEYKVRIVHMDDEDKAKWGFDNLDVSFIPKQEN